MLLSAEHLSINFGSRQLLEDVNFYLNEGDKVGVIGINGTGKSTPVTTQKQSSQYTENIAEVHCGFFQTAGNGNVKFQKSKADVAKSRQ